MTVLLIDNYDSFTYNLYQVISSQTDEKVVVYRNDEIFTDEIALISPSSIVFSPGPGHPANVRDFGICREIIEQYGNKIPMLGVCLGHQGMGLCFGGSLTSAHKILHGKTSSIRHSGTGIFQDIPQDIQVARYHSLILQNENLPDTLEITAITSDKTIMGIAHKSFPIFGIQFHPESFMTEFGTKMIRNFLTLAKTYNMKTKSTVII